MAKARRQAPLLLYCAGRSRRVSSARGSEIPPLLTLFLWSQVGGATAILCSVKCSPVRDTLNLSIYLAGLIVHAEAQGRLSPIDAMLVVNVMSIRISSIYLDRLSSGLDGLLYSPRCAPCTR